MKKVITMSTVRTQQKVLQKPTTCDIQGCNAQVAHIEHWYDRLRGWCTQHTPWSGHYEYCSKLCPVNTTATPAVELNNREELT